MKKILALLPMVLMAYFSFGVDVTFRVDMTGQTVSGSGVHLAGGFGANGYPNWNPGGIAMTDANSDNIYEVTLNLSAGTNYPYKFVNGNSWGQDENPIPSACNVGGNRQVSVGTSNMVLPVYCWMQCSFCSSNPQFKQVTFKVDMQNETVSPNGVHLAGSFHFTPAPFQGPEWNPAGIQMTDANADEVYEVTLTLAEGYGYEYKFINGNNWPSAEGGLNSPCGNGSNRTLNVGTSNMVLNETCFNSCSDCVPSPDPIDVTFLLDMQNATVSPNGVHLAGGFGINGYAQWLPNGIAMTDANSDNVYEVTLTLTEGLTYEYKFINGNSWPFSETANGSCFNGSTNRFFTVGSSNMTLPEVCLSSCSDCTPLFDITFRVDMNFQTVSPNGVHIAGNFGSAGYPQWSPSGIAMTDGNSDGVYEVTLTIPQGTDLQYKFINGNDWPFAESVPSGCGTSDGFGNFNRTHSVTADAVLGVQCFAACGSCVAGCMDNTACNYNASANASDGSCTYAGLTFYVDADNDGVGAGAATLHCSNPGVGYSAVTGDCNDSNNTVYPGAPELCGNGIDNDCDNAIDEGCPSGPANDTRAGATLLSGTTFPACSTVNISLATATSSPETFTNEPVGAADVWYRFVAQTNAVRIQASSGTYDLALELQDNSGGTLMSVENETPSGMEVIVANNLTPGQTYYVAAIRLNNVGGGTMAFCIQHLRASIPDNGTSFSSLCSFMKAKWTGASIYAVSLNDGSNTIVASSSSTQIPFSSLNGIQYGTNYSVTYTCTFNQTDGAGNPVQAVVVSPPYTITIQPHALAQLRTIDRCPVTRSVGSFIGTDIVICGIMGWNWEFVQVDSEDNVIAPQAISINTGTSRFIRLSTVPGLSAGEYYRVRVRPVLSSGLLGAFHSNYQLLCVAGSAGMAVEDGLTQAVLKNASASEEEFNSANVFPNPNNGELIHVMLPNGLNDVRFYDNLGRVVYQNRFVCEGEQLVSITPYTKLESGVYHIEVIKNYQRDSFKLLVE